MGVESVLKTRQVHRVRFVIIAVLLIVSGISARCPEKCDCNVRTQRLECKHEQLTHLPSGPFTRLQHLDLSSNRISILKDYMFADQMMFTIETLILADNEISFVEEQALVGLSSLTYLDLSGNDIAFFKASIFEHTRKITTLKLHNNPGLFIPEEAIDLPALTDITLNGCSLTHLPDKFFEHFKNLEHIDISDNKLTYFDSSRIQELISLKRMDLNKNKITNLYQVLNQLPKSITLLNLLQNQWHCDCELHLVISLYVDQLYRQDLNCSSPKALEGKLISPAVVESIVCTTTSVTEPPVITTDGADIIDDVEELDEDELENVDIFHSMEIEVAVKRQDLRLFPSVDSSTEDEKDEVIAQASWINSNHWWIILLSGLVLMCGVIFIINKQVMRLRKRSSMGKSREDLEENGYQSVNSL